MANSNFRRLMKKLGNVKTILNSKTRNQKGNDTAINALDNINKELHVHKTEGLLSEEECQEIMAELKAHYKKLMIEKLSRKN